MASSPTETNRHNNNPKPTAHLLNSLSLFTAPNTTSSSSSAAIRVALFHRSAAHTYSRPSSSSSAAAVKSPSFASTKSNFKGAGPAFVGQVFSMCDLSGTGLMAVSTHFDLPFISQRTPEFLKKIFASVTSKQRDGPVFRFFVDLGDAVTYVKRLNIPSGVVGACRLDLAYEHFKEKPHMFQFVPNEKQVKEANKLLKTNPKNGNCKRVDGVPVFSAQNLDIAIATEDGIKWYTPYFFDKNMLDNILETSVDRHFHSLIQTRHVQRQRDMIDENLGAEVSEEMGDKLWEEPPEVDEAMDEIGIPEIPLSVISKAAEMQLHYTVDKVLLGNRWLRKATGIQPQFPYMVDTFERRSAASFLRASKSTNCLGEAVNDDKDSLQCATSKADNNNRSEFPSGNLFSRLWSRQKPQDGKLSKEYVEQKSKLGPHFPKITMIGISTAEAGPVNKASVKKTMDDLLRELEQTDSEGYESSDEFRFEDRDPLFVSNVGDSRWKVR